MKPLTDNEARDTVATVARLARVFADCDDYTVRLCGASVPVSRQQLVGFISRGYHRAVRALGKAETAREFAKHQITISSR